MTAYAPTDLREADPRPAEPVLDAEEAIVRELLTTRLHGDELMRALQALGLEEYDRTFNPKGRDAWTRKPLHKRHDNDPRLTRNQTHCKRGHKRAEHTIENRAGVAYCLSCKAADGKRRSAEAAERRKKDAA